MHRRICSVRSKIESAVICFQNCNADIAQDNALISELTQLSNVSEEIVQVLESLAVFAKGSRLTRLELIHRRLGWLIEITSSTIVKLYPYTKKANVATVPTEPVPTVTTAAPRALFNETPAALTPFLATAQKRGWRVTERQLTEQPEGEDSEDLTSSVDLIKKLRRPLTQLLSEDTVVGVIQFPVITLGNKRPSDSSIRRCVTGTLGYDFYLILGSYMVIDKMCLIGIHQSIMRVVDDHKKPVLDTDKFAELQSYAASEQPEWAAILQQTFPVQPAKLGGSHYYCPLVPHTLLQTGRHGIGDWAFLTT